MLFAGWMFQGHLTQRANAEIFEINDLRKLPRPHADDSGTACVRFPDTLHCATQEVHGQRDDVGQLPIAGMCNL